MDSLSLDELDAQSDSFDRHVADSPDVDGYCSSSDWILPAAQALMPSRTPFLRRGEHGYVALMGVEYPSGHVLQPLEAMWGLACPVVGGDERALAAELSAELQRSARRAALMLCGLRRESARFIALARALAGRYDLRVGPTVLRYCADLSAGVDAFLKSRSPNFRVSLKRARRRAGERGLMFERCLVAPNDAAADAAYDRLLAVEARSWKGREGVGIAASEMLGFYRLMIRRLVKRDGLRLMFARHEDRDVAYILGGVRGRSYRGLQFSFDAEYEQLSLGNLCQFQQIVQLCDEGIAQYDLGAEVEYKRRWGEQAQETVTLLALPR